MSRFVCIDSDICGKFSLPVKKIIVGEVVTHLLEKQNGVPLLTSAAHVKWAMEAVGQGFTLPIEEEEIISKVIALYRNWALEPAKRPAPIQADPQFFIQVCVSHRQTDRQTDKRTDTRTHRHTASERARERERESESLRVPICTLLVACITSYYALNCALLLVSYNLP
jgi:hypothetical protein